MNDDPFPAIMERRHPVSRETIDRGSHRGAVTRIAMPEYLGFVRRKACCHCLAPGPSDPHHLGGDGVGGTATKTHDQRTVPLCRECHDYWHASLTYGTLEFWGADTAGELRRVMRELVCEFLHIREDDD